MDFTLLVIIVLIVLTNYLSTFLISYHYNHFSQESGCDAANLGALQKLCNPEVELAVSVVSRDEEMLVVQVLAGKENLRDHVQVRYLKLEKCMIVDYLGFYTCENIVTCQY